MESKKLAKQVNILASQQGYRLRRPRDRESWGTNGAQVALDVVGVKGVSLFFATLNEAYRFLKGGNKKER